MTWTSGEVERQAASLEYIAENARLSESQMRSLVFAARMLREYAGAMAAQPPMTADRDDHLTRRLRAYAAIPLMQEKLGHGEYNLLTQAASEIAALRRRVTALDEVAP